MPPTLTPATPRELRRAPVPQLDDALRRLHELPDRHDLIDEIFEHRRRRPAHLRNVQVRAAGDTGDGAITMRGHAAVYDQETVLWDVGWWRMREIIAPGAFRNVLARSPLVHLVHEHDIRTAMASTEVTGMGSLELDEDQDGLVFFARVNPALGFVQDLALRMEDGVIRQASFAFTIAGCEYDISIDDQGNEDELRTITEIGELYDVSICAQGAFPQTDSEVAARSLAVLDGRAGHDPAGHPTRVASAAATPAADPEGATTVAPDTPAGGDERGRAQRLASLRARARTVLATTPRR